MADEKTVRVKLTLDSKGMTAGLDRINKKVARWIESAILGVDRLNKKLEGLKAGLGRVDQFVKKAGIAFAAAFGSALAATSSLVYGLFKLADLAGPIQQIRFAFDRFVEGLRNADAEFAKAYSSSQTFVRGLQEMAMGTISQTGAMKAATRILATLGPSIGRDLPRYFQIATAAAQVFGTTTESMLDKIARSSVTVFARTLSQAGIVIDLETAYANYRKELGLTTEALTRQQKAIAIFNETLRMGDHLIQAMGNAELLLATRTQAARAMIIDLRDSLLNQLAPALSVLMGYIRDFVDDSIPKTEAFATAFIDTFQQIPSEAEKGFWGIPGIVDEGAARMGNRAAQWAMDALSWGANIGSEFAIGILEGFTAVIVTVMNAIASILSSWLGPGSPPRVAPNIDKWGALAMMEFAKGMEKGFDPDFRKMLDELRQTLEAMPRRELLEWGISAIAAWAKGLSIFDLSLLEHKIEQDLKKATSVRDQLAEQLSKERTELFKLQVLGKDPAAIRQKLLQVKATENATRAQEREVKALERRRDEIRQQLQLMRLLDRILKKLDDTQKKARERKPRVPRGGAPPLPMAEPLAFPFERMGGALSDLEARMEGFANTLRTIFEEPLANLTTAWENAASRISTAWTNIRTILESAGILDYLGDPGWARFVGTILGSVVALGLLRLALIPVINLLGFLVTPLGLLIVLIATLGAHFHTMATEKAPRLSAHLSIMQRMLLGLWYYADLASKGMGLLFYGIGSVGAALFRAIAAIADFVAAFADMMGAIDIFGVWDALSGRLTTLAADLRETASTGMVEIGQMTAGFDTGFDSMVGSAGDWLEQNAALQREGKKLPDLGTQTAKALSGAGIDLTWFAQWNTGLSENIVTPMEELVPTFETQMQDMADYADTFAIDGTASFDQLTSDSTRLMQDFSNDVVGTGGVLPDMTKTGENIWSKHSTKLIGDTGIITKMFSDIETGTLNLKTQMIGETGHWTVMCDTMRWRIDGVTAAVNKLLDGLISLRDWVDTNAILIRIHWPEPPDWWWQVCPKSLPPFARGIRMINKELRDTGAVIRGLPAQAMFSPPPTPAGGGSTIITFAEPLVGAMIVPNMQVGREMSEQIASDIGDMIQVRRRPA